MKFKQMRKAMRSQTSTTPPPKLDRPEPPVLRPQICSKKQTAAMITSLSTARNLQQHHRSTLASQFHTSRPPPTRQIALRIPATKPQGPLSLAPSLGRVSRLSVPCWAPATSSGK
ncbi:hypothetical protein KC19_1G333800 [Ceratodon purpureus]|uniref:Uncharacterized protein n=1 Tax=Ceratodon purpureus TaxID=3225 RepID=A0A8T0JDN2_CERPU|nr:hypothetical protein KC19_1G333800 [Ceratodon purpureus]